MAEPRRVEVGGARARRTCACLLLAGALLGGCGDDEDGSTSATTVVQGGDEGSHAITATDGAVLDGTTLTVDEVVLATGQGYVAAYADGDGAPGLLLGASDRIGPGRVADVRIELDEAPPGDTVHLIVHTEDNGNASFDFPDGDAPASDGPGVLEVVVRIGEGATGSDEG